MSWLSHTLYALAGIELSNSGKMLKVREVAFDHSANALTVICNGDQSIRMTPDSDTVIGALQTVIPTLVEPRPDYMLPSEPSVDQSWALVHYDLAITWDAFDQCVPPANLTAVQRVGNEAQCLMASDDRTETIVLDLRGRSLEGTAVDLAFEWNRRMSAQL